MPGFGFGFSESVRHSSQLNQEPPMADFITAFNAITTPKITGNSSTFAGANSWVTALGSLQPDIATYPGEMYLNFTTGNQAVKIDPCVDTTNYFLIRVKARKVSGTGMTIRLGAAVSGSLQNNMLDITPVTESRWYYGYCYAFANTIFYICCLSAANNGTKIAIEEIHVDQVAVADILALDYEKVPQTYNASTLFDGITQSTKSLLKVAMLGDSLMANNGVESLTYDEGNTMRPPRLTTRSTPRLFYDRLKFNPPTFRRLDHAAWMKSTLSGSNDFSEMTASAVGTYRTPWHPNNNEEKYFRTGQSGAFCEITIPDGQENAVIFYRTDTAAGGVPMDSAIAVTLNGGSIAAYGDAAVNELRADPSVGYETLYGFGFNALQYSNLPAGVNVIRLTKSADTKEFHLWGGAYWHGNSMVFLNLAYGGLDVTGMMYDMAKYIYKNTYDAFIFEITIGNDAGHSIALATQIRNFFALINRDIPLSKTLFFSPYPFGIDPTDGTPNYYTLWTPNQFDSSTLRIKLLAWLGFRYIDTFKPFRSDIIARGGTLAGGQAGTYYTVDGLHPNATAVNNLNAFLVTKVPTIPLT